MKIIWRDIITTFFNSFHNGLYLLSTLDRVFSTHRIRRDWTNFLGSNQEIKFYRFREAYQYHVIVSIPAFIFTSHVLIYWLQVNLIIPGSVFLEISVFCTSNCINISRLWLFIVGNIEVWILFACVANLSLVFTIFIALTLVLHEAVDVGSTAAILRGLLSTVNLSFSEITSRKSRRGDFKFVQLTHYVI